MRNAVPILIVAAFVLAVLVLPFSAWTQPGVGGPGYRLFRYDGSDLMVRPTAHWTGDLIACSDDATNFETDCDVDIPTCTPASNDCEIIHVDNTSDASAPGSGKTTIYSKSGQFYRRAGAAGSAYKVATREDTELFTHQGCIPLEDPVSDDDWYSVWRAPQAVTITEMWCEVVGGTSAVANLQVDDGTPEDVNGSDITCDTNGEVDSTMEGDNQMVAGETLDLDMGTVTGAVTQFTMCFKFTYDD